METLQRLSSGGATAPLALPARRAAGGGFGAELRSRLYAEAMDSLREQLAGPAAVSAPRASAAASASRATGRPSLQLKTDGEWADLARSIGRQYLGDQQAETFVRQIALESGNFDPDVISGRRVSVAGAEGIAQLMPASYPRVDRRDPVASLHAAAATMRSNLLSYGGDMAKALAAYNAGSGRVAETVARYGAGWVGGLPAETQTYLRELLGNTYG